MEKFILLLKELKVSLLNTPDGSKFYGKQQQAETTGWVDHFCSEGLSKLASSPTAAEALVISAATKWCRQLMQRVVRSVIYLIEQTQGTGLPSVSSRYASHYRCGSASLFFVCILEKFLVLRQKPYRKNDDKWSQEKHREAIESIDRNGKKKNKIMWPSWKERLHWFMLSMIGVGANFCEWW